jgi:hypothetical protein
VTAVCGPRLEETLTVRRLNVPPSLARTLRSTNAIKSMISIRAYPLPKREELAEREHGATLVRRRHDRSPRPVPPRQRVTSTWQHCEPPSMRMSPP